MLCRFAICDDEAAAREQLAGMVRDWAEARGHAAPVECFPSAEAFQFRYAEEQRFDVLLLDIEMGGMNGVALAKGIRAENRQVQIVFVTGYMEYIADGYDVEALHYLIKPVTLEKLHAVLDRAVERLARSARVLTLHLAQGYVRVPLHEIRYLEVQRNYVTVYAREDYTVKAALGELERELDEQFCRVGRSYILNLRCIRSVTRTQALLAGGERIPLPRGVYDALNRAMMDRL